MSSFRSLALYFLYNSGFSFFLSLLLCDLLAFLGDGSLVVQGDFYFYIKEIPLVMCFCLLFFIIFLCTSLIFCFMSVAHICMYIFMQFISYLSFVLFHFKVPFLVFLNIFGLNSTLSDETATSLIRIFLVYICLKSL